MGTVKHMGTVASVSEYLSCIEKTDTLSLTTLTVSNFTFIEDKQIKTGICHLAYIDRLIWYRKCIDGRIKSYLSF